MEMLMQPWKLEYETDGINLGNWRLCWPIRMFPFLWEGSYTQVVYEVVCYMAVKLGWWRKKVSLQWGKLRIIRWMCSVKVTYRFRCNWLRERLGTDGIITVQQVEMVWTGLVVVCILYAIVGQPRNSIIICRVQLGQATSQWESLDAVLSRDSSLGLVVFLTVLVVWYWY